MNTLNLKAIVAICGALFHPVTLAQGFTQVPAPVVRARRAQPELVRTFSTEINKGKRALAEVRKDTDNLYIEFVELTFEQVCAVVEPKSKKIFANFEQHIRSVEETIKLVLDEPDMPAFAVTEMRGYLREIAKTRNSVARLNGFLRQLEPAAVVFKGSVDISVLEELAATTTEKLGSMQLH